MQKKQFTKYAYFGGGICIEISGKNEPYRRMGACYISKGHFKN